MMENFPLFISQRESLVSVKFCNPEISMIFDDSELPESKFCLLENAFTHTRCYVGLDHFWQYLIKPPADVL